MGAGPLVRIVSIFISTMIVMLAFLGCVPQLVMYARADTQLELNAGNITLQLSDAGRFWDVEVDLGATTLNPLVDFQQHFFLYHDGYGVDTIAALYPPLPIEDGDFEVIGGIDVPLGWEETGSTQKIFGTFTETRITDPDDVRIHQTAWTQEGAFWVVIEWEIENIYGSDLTGACAGIRLCSNFENDGAEDDLDIWDDLNSTYYYTDLDATDKYFGFSSANATMPIDHYYGTDGRNATDWPFLPMQGADATIYNAINSLNQTDNITAPDQKIGSVVDWNLSTISAGGRAEIALVVAFGSSPEGLIENVTAAQAFYAVASLPHPDLIITEVMDSGVDEYIEVFNKGDGEANVADINISVDGGATNITGGSWNSSSIPIGGYGIFKTGANMIDDEGDTVTVFYIPDNSLQDEMSFGCEGYPPDPPPNESIARIYGGTMYTNDWNRDGTPTFGDGLGPDYSDEENDPPGIEPWPLTRINEVMFNPNSEKMFIELISFLDPGNLNGTQIVCDSVYTLGDYLVVDEDQKNYYTLYEDSFPAGFDVTAAQDNIYLYDKDGMLMDMVGWNSSHDFNRSVRRNFEGIGDFDGWNDVTTEGAGWSFNNTPTPYFELMLTEIQDSPTGREAVELYYRAEKNSAFNFSDWRMTYNGINITIPMGTQIPGGGYLIFGDHPNATVSLGMALHDEGGNVSLFDDNNTLYSWKGYGTNGTAPDPFPGESCAKTLRIYIDDLYIYQEGWNRAKTATIGSKNTVPPVSPEPHLKLNEVLYNPDQKVGFIELIYDGNFITYNMTDTNTYPFINASSGGVPLSFADGDDGYRGVWMEFSFNFYGQDYNLIQVGVNGYLSFATYPDRPDNQDLPLGDENMRLVLAPMWDDLNLSASQGGGIYYKTTGNSPNRVFTITYYRIEHKSGPSYDYDGKYMTFEVNLYEADGTIVFQYEDLTPGSINLNNPDDPSNHTLGLNNGDGIRSIQHDLLTDGDSGLDIVFTPMFDMDITGYTIVCDDEYTIGVGGQVLVAPIDPYTTLIELVGWSTPHLMDRSMNRWPEGFGTPDGYDDNSSIHAGWQFNRNPTMQYKPPYFTEVRDSQTEQIEIYNPSISGVNLSLGKGWYLEIVSSMTQVNLSSYGVISSGGYINFTLAEGNLDDEGDEIRLYDEMDTMWTRLKYGTMGSVPDPLTTESVSRYWEGTYSENWTRDSTPTFGYGNEQNDAPGHNESQMVVLNEVMFNPDFIEYSFVEIKLIANEPLDISGYKIVCDDEYVIPGGTVLDLIDPYFILLYEDANYFFANVTPTGDNIYLYTDSDNLIDMVGWNSAHQQNKSVARVPEGAGLFRYGFDDVSSAFAGWVFNQTPTVPLILVGPDITGYGFPGENITYNLTLRNKYTEVESLEFSYLSVPNGWVVIILDEFGVPLADTNGNGKPDITLNPGESKNITVIVLIPNIFPMVDLETTTIRIQGYFNPVFGDLAILESRLYPHLQLMKSASPTIVNPNGTGYDEEFTITLNITGSGYGQKEQLPQDVIFIVDRSGSMSMSDINLAKEALLNYTYDMSLPDLGAVVHFDSVVVLMSNLTADYEDLRDDIENIPSPGGSTYMGEAMRAGTNELLNNGEDGHIWVMILLSDGSPNGAMDPLDEADYAADGGIIIYTIGLGMTPNSTEEQLMEDIANRTGGEYFRAESAADLNDIYVIISGFVKQIAAIDTNTNDSTPMIVDVLPPWINLVPGSFNINPDHITVDAGGNTTLEWNKTLINIGESFEITFNCTSTKMGNVLTNVIAESRANYTRWDNKTTQVLFPPNYVFVGGEVLPPELYIETAGLDSDDIFLR
jgi:Ca-activated chloride channel family protein